VNEEQTAKSPVFVRGMVVKSIAGRDKNRLLVVAEVTQAHVLVIDGRERPIQRPKRKNARHIFPAGHMLPEETLRFNNPLRKALNRLAESTPKPTQATEGRALNVQARYD
jgi:ribosomal protein L14E/L6E/L27E